VNKDETQGPAGPCKICEQEHGAMRYQQDFTVVCFRCHMMTGAAKVSAENAEQAAKYFEAVGAGERFEPIYDTTDWGVIEKAHGVKWPKGQITTELESLDGGRESEGTKTATF
jgi:predicted type IV restriction endonuclease